jgi:hypothetical protein
VNARRWRRLRGGKQIGAYAVDAALPTVIDEILRHRSGFARRDTVGSKTG